MQQEPTKMSTTLHEPPSYWQETAPRVAFSPHLPSGADVVIIGGGLLGAAICYWVARTGRSVILLERTTLAGGATGRNGGFISVGPDKPYAEAIARLGYETARTILDVTLDSQKLLRHMIEEENIACDYREPGHLHLTLQEEELRIFAQSSFALQQDGVSAVLLNREQMREFITTPLGPQIRGALFVPNMGLVHPVKLVQGIVAAAQRYGARSMMTTVQHLSAEGDGIRLQTTHGSLSAQRVIVATNAWIPDLLPQMRQVITPVRGQVLTYQPLPPLFTTGVTVDLSGSEEYWQQAPDGSIILGGCRMVAEGHDIGIRVSQPTGVVQNALEQVFPHLFPSLPELHVAHRWAGLMAFTPDFLPIADRVPDLPHTWVVGGFCGHGMPFGLRFGQLLAEAVVNGVVSPLLKPFRFNRPTLQP